ncbi:class I SAM-dependent methyltransferase [Halobacillus sp. ACCC02827]|uniref:class I SAM-dependent methyltransferase n=1 Tax=unclassified Halobacillus TaxID=2636472 RepID=UPI0002A4E381|nr:MULTISPECIES: class I SAM-dependent methyltransferase [Bacillaceae]ELK44902.1 methyltransferase YbaJ [Halobacillus sp. BAB-2008]WJE14293.1 class I SAM-dependent methyltransferase [Halobacillus sp. ACCC02827]
MEHVTEHNSKAWDKKVEEGVRYTASVSSLTVEEAKAGVWSIGVTADKQIPRNWFPPSMEGRKVLCLASGGGQQGPVLAAAGADVTVFDLSEKQLEQDRKVAKAESLSLQTVKGDMTNLSCFRDETFDLIIHPVSNVFIPDIRPVWGEASRVLKEKGVLISGFMNPVLYLFDEEKEAAGKLEVVHKIPYSPLEEEVREGEALEFGHTLEDQLQGQMDAGFVITDMYEDNFGDGRLVDSYIKTMMATRAVNVRL